MCVSALLLYACLVLGLFPCSMRLETKGDQVRLRLPVPLLQELCAVPVSLPVSVSFLLGVIVVA